MKKLISLGGFFCFLILLLAMPAFAVDQVEPAGPFALGLIAFLSNVVFPLMGAITSIVLTLLLHWLSKKLKLEALTKQEARLHDAIWNAVGFAEEQAAKRIKAGNPIISGGEKMNLAIGKVLEMFPKLDPEKAREAIEARLPFGQHVGATGEQKIG